MKSGQVCVNLWRLVIALVIPTAAAAQASPPADALALTANGAFIAMSVADLPASTRWYSEKLGLKVVMESPRRDKFTVTVLEGGGLIVELIQNDDAVPLRTAAPAATSNFLVHGIFKAGVIVDDLDKTLATLRARGVEIAIGPFPRRGDQRANVIIKDNSGNLIQLFGQ